MVHCFCFLDMQVTVTVEPVLPLRIAKSVQQLCKYPLKKVNKTKQNKKPIKNVNNEN